MVFANSLLCFLCFFVVEASAARVHVRAESVVSGDVLKLGDVAEITAGDVQLEAQLKAISLGYAPQVGTVRELPKAKIVLALNAAGFSPEVNGAVIARVKRASQIVSPSLISKAVETSLLTELQATGATAKISRLDLPPVIEVPSGDLEVRASAMGVKSLFAPFSVALEFWVDGRLARRVTTTAQVEASAKVLVAARDLSGKTRLREGDFALASVQLERHPSLYLHDPRRLRGAALINPLAAGEAITLDALTSEIVIKPGDPVRIVGESKSLNIAVMGEARASGRVGDRIQVKNLQSGLLLQALIIDEGVVGVRF